MAKRRLLKKDISYIAGDLVSEVVLLTHLVPGIEQKKAESLITRIIDMNDTFIRRAHQPAGKDNKKIVKEYYAKLIADLQDELNAIADEIESLSNLKAE